MSHAWAYFNGAWALLCQTSGLMDAQHGWDV